MNPVEQLIDFFERAKADEETMAADCLKHGYDYAFSRHEARAGILGKMVLPMVRAALVELQAQSRIRADFDAECG